MTWEWFIAIARRRAYYRSCLSLLIPETVSSVGACGFRFRSLLIQWHPAEVQGKPCSSGEIEVCPDRFSFCTDGLENAPGLRSQDVRKHLICSLGISKYSAQKFAVFGSRVREVRIAWIISCREYRCSTERICSGRPIVRSLTITNRVCFRGSSCVRSTSQKSVSALGGSSRNSPVSCDECAIMVSNMSLFRKRKERRGRKNRKEQRK